MDPARICKKNSKKKTEQIFSYIFVFMDTARITRHSQEIFVFMDPAKIIKTLTNTCGFGEPDKELEEPGRGEPGRARTRASK